jgi:hypothetical protein
MADNKMLGSVPYGCPSIFALSRLLPGGGGSAAAPNTAGLLWQRTVAEWLYIPTSTVFPSAKTTPRLLEVGRKPIDKARAS